MLDDVRILKILKEKGEPDYRYKQIKKWVYRQGVLDFTKMSDLPVFLQKSLASGIRISSLEIHSRLDSQDGQTSKVALLTRDRHVIEIVLLRYKTGRTAVCISSQIGCPVGCVFCATGKMGFVRNLTAEEICDQVLLARHILQSEPMDKEADSLPSNVIVMGMGEPFLNYDATLEALKSIQSDLGIGGRRLTVSTVGIVPMIEQFTKEDMQINLAISLHAVDESLRSDLIPMNKKYPLAQLRSAVVKYIESTKRKVFFEYVMLEGINDSEEHARTLGEWLPTDLVHVNLIRLNFFKGSGYNPSSKQKIKEFQEILLSRKIPVTVRYPMGDDIKAACGQLASKITKGVSCKQKKDLILG